MGVISFRQRASFHPHPRPAPPRLGLVRREWVSVEGWSVVTACAIAVSTFGPSATELEALAAITNFSRCSLTNPAPVSTSKIASGRRPVQSALAAWAPSASRRARTGSIAAIRASCSAFGRLVALPITSSGSGSPKFHARLACNHATCLAGGWRRKPDGNLSPAVAWLKAYSASAGSISPISR